MTDHVGDPSPTDIDAKHAIPPRMPAPQDTARLGAHLDDSGCRFTLWAPRAERVELAAR